MHEPKGSLPLLQQGAATQLPRKLASLHSLRKYPLPSHSHLNSRQMWVQIWSIQQSLSRPGEGAGESWSQRLRMRTHFSWCCTRAPVPSRRALSRAALSQALGPSWRVSSTRALSLQGCLGDVSGWGGTGSPVGSNLVFPRGSCRSKSAWVGVGSRRTAPEMGSSEGKITERFTGSLSFSFGGPSPLTCGIRGTVWEGWLEGSLPFFAVLLCRGVSSQELHSWRISQGRALPAEVWVPYPSSRVTPGRVLATENQSWAQEGRTGGSSLGCAVRWAHLPAQAAFSATPSAVGEAILTCVFHSLSEFSSSSVHSQLTVLWVTRSHS